MERQHKRLMVLVLTLGLIVNVVHASTDSKRRGGLGMDIQQEEQMAERLGTEYSPESIYQSLGMDGGIDTFVDSVSSLNSANLKRTADIKAGVFAEMGLGEVREQLVDQELVGVTRELSKEVNHLTSRFELGV